MNNKKEKVYWILGNLIGLFLIVWGNLIGSPFIAAFFFLAALFVFVFYPHIVSIDYRLREISKVLLDIAEDEE